MKTVFLRVLGADDKSKALLEAVPRTSQTGGPVRYEIDVNEFSKMPKSPFAYWVSDHVRDLYQVFPSLGSRADCVTKVGLQTSGDFRFVRAWWETKPSSSSRRWFPFSRGEPSPSFYGEISCQVGYSRGDQVGLAQTGRFGRGAEYYFHPGLAWTLRARRFVPRVLPSGCIFSQRGQSFFCPDDELLVLLALFNGSTIDFFYKISLGRFGFPEFLVGPLSTIPLPQIDGAAEGLWADLARRGWSLRRSLSTRIETSHAFLLPALIQVDGESLSARAAGWENRIRMVEAELDAIHAEINELSFELYGIEGSDRDAVAEGLVGKAHEEEEEDGKREDTDEDASNEDEPEVHAEPSALIAELVSWAVGVAFGRFDLRLATGQRALPSEPEPFAPLPACSPGMLIDETGQLIERAPEFYPIDFPLNGILVDDTGHPLAWISHTN